MIAYKITKKVTNHIKSVSGGDFRPKHPKNFMCNIKVIILLNHLKTTKYHQNT